MKHQYGPHTVEFIHRLISVILATTTWLTIAPTMKDYGWLSVVLVCIVTVVIEISGYAATKAGLRSENVSLLAYGFIIMMGSATFTFWGGRLLSTLIIEKRGNTIQKDYAQEIARIDEIKTRERTEYLKRQDAFEAQKKADLERLDDDFAKAIRRSSRNADFADRYIEGRDVSYFRKHKSYTVRQYAVNADKIQRQFAEARSRISARKFDLQAPDSRETEISGAQKIAEDRKKATAVIANIGRKTIWMVDFIGGLFSVLLFMGGIRNPEMFTTDSESLVLSLIERGQYEWSQLAIRISPEQKQYYSDEERQLEVESVFRRKDEEVKELKTEIGRIKNYVGTLKEEFRTVQEQLRTKTSEFESLMEQFLDQEEQIRNRYDNLLKNKEVEQEQLQEQIRELKEQLSGSRAEKSELFEGSEEQFKLVSGDWCVMWRDRWRNKAWFQDMIQRNEKRAAARMNENNPESAKNYFRNVDEMTKMLIAIEEKETQNIRKIG